VTPLPWRPFYFGPQEAPLFGCHHPARRTDAPRRAMVVCPPLGHESIACHRALRQLAVHLSRAGVAALRFDYFGTGDSAGGCHEVSLTVSRDNVGTAVETLRHLEDGPEVGLAGLRLGASLAILHAADTGEVPVMVLWDPVLAGRAHLEEMLALHRERFPRSRARDNDAEILGFPMTTALRGELEALDLLKVERRPARRVLMVDTERERTSEPLAIHLEELGCRVEHAFTETPAMWREQPDKVVVPVKVLRHVASWLGASGD
jgi:pimeloyl-ACP methyl ester carboxylesterase